MPFVAWCDVGHSLRVLSEASAWCLGDWLNYGERAYGQRYKEALELTGLDYQTLRNYAWVARRFPLSRRRDGASFQHHAEVAALPDALQDLLLERSERFRWSRAELRREVRKFRHAEMSENGNALPRPAGSVEVVVSISVAAEREQRWRQAAADVGQSVDEWIATLADTAAAAVLNETRSGQLTSALNDHLPRSLR